MIFQETTRTRCLVGRIDDEDLVETLTKLCEDHDVQAGQLRASGALSAVELARFDVDSGEYAPGFSGEGHFELLSLTGNVSRLGDEVVVRLETVMSVAGPAGPQIVTGQLRSGRAVSVEFVLDIFEDLTIERRLDADSGRLDIHSIRRRTPPQATGDDASSAATNPDDAADEPVAGKGMSWSDAAETNPDIGEASGADAAAGTSEQQQQPDARDIYAGVDFEETLMEAGDVLEHPKLGTCRVMKVEDGDFAHVRLPRGRIRKLSLDIVEVELEREEDGRRVFQATINK